MGTGSSLSSIDHNIFQKPYEAPPNAPGRSSPYLPPNAPPLPAVAPTQHSHYVPPLPSAPYDYDQPGYSFPNSHQPVPIPTDLGGPNIFYTPPSSFARSDVPSPFVKQEHFSMPPVRSMPGWHEDGQGSDSYNDYYGPRKRKLSPCEMAYPDLNSAASPTNYRAPNCNSYLYASNPSNHPSNLPPPALPYDYKPEGALYSTREPSNVQFQPSFPLKQEKKETLTTTTNTEGDGYRWRKYGRKTVKGSPYPRSYYKCTFSSCNVKKQVEMTVKDDKMVVKTCIYKGEHNHDRPCITFAKASNQMAFKNAVIAGFVRHEKMLQGTGDVPRLSVETSKDVDFMDDGYRWRKYGQKYVKGSGYPRSYYKCTEKDCSVKKQVDQHGDRITNTYEGVHSHAPCTANSRKRRKCGDGEKSASKGGGDAYCPTPPGSSSDGADGAASRRQWQDGARRSAGGVTQLVDDHEEEEGEDEELGMQPVRLFGAAVEDDDDDDELDDEDDFDAGGELDDDDDEFVADLKSLDKDAHKPATRNLRHQHLP